MVRKALVLGMLLILLTLLTNEAFAAGKLVTTQESLSVIPYYTDGYYGIVYAELSNAGDKPVEFSSGLVELFDPDGNSIASSDVYYCYPPVLQPGENGYVYTSSYIETTDEDFISDHMLTVTGKGTISQNIVRLNSTARYEQISDDYGTYDYLVTVIENNTEQVVTACEVVFNMKDAEGNIIYVTTSSWSGYNVGIMPGSSVEMRVQMGTDVLDYMTNNTIIPATVESVAYFSASIQ